MKILNQIATYSALIMTLLKLFHIINVSWLLVFSLPLALILWGFIQGLFEGKNKR